MSLLRGLPIKIAADSLADTPQLVRPPGSTYRVSSRAVRHLRHSRHSMRALNNLMELFNEREAQTTRSKYALDTF